MKIGSKSSKEMLRQLVVLLLVCAPNLVLCETGGPALKPLPFIQNDNTLNPTLTAIKTAMVAAAPDREAPITEQMKALEGLAGANEEERNSIFRNFFDAQLKLFIGLLGMGEIDIGDYRGLLTESDRDLLVHFRNISTAETKVLLACPPDYLPQYREQEPTDYKPTWGEATCALRLMLQEMTKLQVVSPAVALEVFKSMHMTYPEYAASVFHSGQVSGDVLVLPLVLTQKVYEMTPRKKFGTKTLTPPSGVTRGAVLDELAANQITVEEVIELVLKRIVKYYEKLEKDVFCKIKCPASIALNFADDHACFGTRQPEKKKPGAGQSKTRRSGE